MTAATVVSRAKSYTGPAASHSCTLPATINAGNLIVICAGSNDNALTPPVGWATKATIGAALYYGKIITKVADGTEGGTSVTWSTSSGKYVGFAVHVLQDAGDIEVASTYGYAANPDPPSLTPSWGSADYLWIAVARQWNVDIAGGPSGYSNYADNYASGRDNMATAEKSSTASSENPGTFSSGTGYYWAATIAVKYQAQSAAFNPTLFIGGGI